MKIKLWNYLKKHNQIATPSTGGDEFDILLKKPTSFNNPVFILELPDIPHYNYLYWQDVNQYYYVNDIISMNNDMWEIHCEVDPLGTCKNYILAADAFVKYSTLNFDPYLKDDRIIPTSQITTIASNNSFVGVFNEHPEYTSSYSLLLTVISGYSYEEQGETREDGGVKHYIINQNNLRYICQELVMNGDSIIDGVKQVFADAKESLIKLQIIPWKLDILQSAGVAADSASSIYLGSYDTGVTGYEVGVCAYYQGDDFVDLPTRPDDFTRVEPYSEAKVHIPLIGTFDLSLAELEDVNRIYFRYFANIASGKVTCVLFKGNHDINNPDTKIIGSYDGNVNAEVPLGYVSSANPVGVLTGVGSLAVGLASGGALTVAGIAGAVASFASQFKRQSTMIGSYGNNIAAKDNLKLGIYMFKHTLSEQPANIAALYGRPCGKVLNLSTLANGYVETSQFSLQAPFDAKIIDEVNSLMDKGVYLY